MVNTTIDVEIYDYHGIVATDFHLLQQQNDNQNLDRPTPIHHQSNNKLTFLLTKESKENR